MPVDAGDVGRRVVVRSRLPGAGAGGGPAMTDVVGVLVEADDEVLSVRRRDGTVTRVLVADVVTAKRTTGLPGGRPGVGLRISAEDLQRITDAGWPATLTQSLGNWLLRAAGGFTGRANSVSVHGDPGRPFADALHAVQDFYDRQGLPPMAQVVVGSAWEGAFGRAGWRTRPGGHVGAVVQVAAVRTALRFGAASPPVPRGDVRIESGVSDAWLARYHRATDVDAATVRQVLEGPACVRFALIGNEPVAIGRLVLQEDWAGMAAVEVAASFRRRGLARQIVDALLAQAAEHGARWCYLQTMEHNTAALRLYEHYGFVTHHRYRYLVPPVER